MNAHRFPIGTKYTTRGKHVQVCTVVDQLTTTNSLGKVVANSYITSHEFCGQTVTETGVADSTIARGLLSEFAHLLAA